MNISAHPDAHALPDGQVHQVEQEVERQQEDDDAEPQDEGEQVLAKDVAFQYSHGFPDGEDIGRTEARV